MRVLLAFVFVLVSRPAVAESTILVLGDSLSAAYNLSVDEGWVALLEDRLAALVCGTSVVNASISGETSIGGLNRLPNLLETHQPSLVIVELGGNDGLRGFPTRELERNLAQMIQIGREAGAKVLLAGIQIPTNYGSRYTREFREVFPTVAEQHGVPLIPFLLDGIALDPTLMQSDGIHPNAEAQPLLLDNVWPVVAPLLNCAASQSDDQPPDYTEG